MHGDFIPQDHRKATIFLSVLLLITLIFAAIIGYPFFKPLAYALILATVFHPIYAQLFLQTHRPNLSALISTAIIFLMIIVPVVLLLNIAAIQAVSLAHGIAAKSASQGGFVPYLAKLLQHPFEILGRFVDLSNFNLEDQLAEHLQTFGLKLLPTAASWVGNIFGALANTVLALIACYFLLRDGTYLTQKVIELLPITDEHAAHLVLTLKNTILANVQGVFAVGAVQGAVTGIALAILGVGPATLLGILAALCSIVPFVGTGLVWAPAAIYLISTGHLVKGIVLLGIGVGVISMLDNVIRPLVVGTRVQANAFVLMLAMLGGVAAFGFLGLFIGPVVTAMLIAVGKMLREEVAASQQHESETAHAPQ
jgi:predicted PurR-regulated permease PerM